MIVFAVAEGIAKPMPALVPEGDSIATLIPIS